MRNFKQFLNACVEKFGHKFEYVESTFIDENTEMTIMFDNVPFQMKPKHHLKSETGFPRVVNYNLFYVMAKDALGDEFSDYEFIEDSYRTYGVPMTIKYKGIQYRRIPSKIVNYFSRKNPEYEEFKAIAAQYQNYEDLSREHSLVFPKIRERLWTELVEHFDIYHKDYADIDCIKQKISEYKKENKSVEQFIIDEPKMFITLKLSNKIDLLYKNLTYEDNIKLPSTAKIKNGKDRCIYAYEFIIKDKKYIYVGLTVDHIKRDKEHRSGIKSAVYCFSKRNNIEIPKMKVIIDYEDEKIAKRDEGKVLQKYINDGYIKINIAKTGSLGGQTKRFEGTKEDCIKILKENNITYRTLWANLHFSSYIWAKNNNLLDELLPKQGQNNFTYEECLEDARKYESGKEWMRCSRILYRYARNHHWLTDITHELRPSTCIAMCSVFDDNIIYCVFEKVSEAENLFGFREDGIIRAMTDERDTYMNFVWKRITYKQYENMKYINGRLSKSDVLEISKKSERYRKYNLNELPILICDKNDHNIIIKIYKSQTEATISEKRSHKYLKNHIKRCSEGVELKDGELFWRYGTIEEWYDYYKKEIDDLKKLGTVFSD